MARLSSPCTHVSTYRGGGHREDGSLARNDAVPFTDRSLLSARTLKKEHPSAHAVSFDVGTKSDLGMDVRCSRLVVTFEGHRAFASAHRDLLPLAFEDATEVRIFSARCFGM